MDLDLNSGSSSSSASEESSSADGSAGSITLPYVNGRSGDRAYPYTYIQADAIFEAQQVRQTELLKIETSKIVNETCTVDMSDLSGKTLEELLTREPYNAEILKLTFCSVQNAFLQKDSLAGVNAIINSSLTGFHILASGKYGGVYRMVFHGNGRLFVLKVPLPGSDGGHIHEFFVGLQLNQLECPNFMYSFGVFSCFSNVTNAFDKLCLEPTRYDRPEYFLLQEFIRGQELETVFMDVSMDDLLGIYFQLLLALDLAYKKVGFTHYDLHARNIMLQDTNSIVYIPYEWDGHPVHVKTRFVVKIIDYGHSHVSYGGESYGYIPAFTFRVPGFRPLDANPLFDLYKMTGCIGHRLLHYGNYDVFERFWPFLHRFPSIEFNTADLNESDLAREIDDIDSRYWEYDDKDRVMISPHVFTDTIRFAFDNIPETPTVILRQRPTSGKIYSCFNGCTTIENIKDVMVSGIPTKKSKA